MARAAAATRRKAPSAPAPVSLFDDDARLDDMPAEFRECYEGQRHDFVKTSAETVATARGKIKQRIIYLRCTRCTMTARDTFDVILRSESGRYVLRRAKQRSYERPSVTGDDGTEIKYGVTGGRVDHDILVTRRMLLIDPELADLMAGGM